LSAVILKKRFVLILLFIQSNVVAAPFLNMKTSVGDFTIELFDQAAPGTVSNFLEYVNSGRYQKTVIHRSVPDFIIQGGWLTYNDVSQSLEIIRLDEAIENEYKTSNLRGTIAMAKIGSDPNSASSQWFINLSDNSANLDTQNGGFTVFGRVVGEGMRVVDQIGKFPTYTLGTDFGQLQNFPLVDLSTQVTSSNFITISAIESVPDIKWPNYYDEESKELRVKVDLGGSGLYSLAFSILESQQEVTLKLELNSIQSSENKELKMASFNAARGLLFLPELYSGNYLVFKDVELILTDPVRLLFSLGSFDEP
jgi:peptidyl-prolyl cis-trans isomerase A (cyclophilin A)